MNRFDTFMHDLRSVAKYDVSFDSCDCCGTRIELTSDPVYGDYIKSEDFDKVLSDNPALLVSQLVECAKVFIQKRDAAPDGELGLGLTNGDFFRLREALEAFEEEA